MPSPIKFYSFVALVVGIVIALNLAPAIAPQEEQRSEDYLRLQKSYWQILPRFWPACPWLIAVGHIFIVHSTSSKKV